MSDDQKMPGAPNEISELKFKIEMLEDQLDHIGYLNTLLCIMVRDMLVSGKVKKEHINFLTMNEFDVTIDPEYFD
jgi:hypothetical protein